MAPPLSLSQSAFLLSALVASPPSRLDRRPLLSFRPLVLSSLIEAGAATLSLGETSISAVVDAQVTKSSEGLQEGSNDDEIEGPGGDDVEEDAKNGPWSVSISPGPGCVPPLINGGNSSKTGHVELDASLKQLERMIRRHLNETLPVDNFIIVPGPHPPQPAESSSPSLRLPPSAYLRGSTHWSLQLDITVESMAGGNLYDAIWACAYAAIYRTRIPQTRQVAYIPTTSASASSSSAAATTDQTAAQDREKFGMGSIKGQKSRRGGGADAGPAGSSGTNLDPVRRATDFELVDGSDDGLSIRGRELLGVGLTVSLLPYTSDPSNAHLLDTSLEEELSLPSARRLFLVVGADQSIQSTTLLPSLLNLTAGEASNSSDGQEDSLRFPLPAENVSSSDAEKATTELGGRSWGTPSYARLRLAMTVGVRYGGEWRSVLNKWLTDEEKEKTGTDGDGDGDGDVKMA